MKITKKQLTVTLIVVLAIGLVATGIYAVGKDSDSATISNKSTTQQPNNPSTPSSMPTQSTEQQLVYLIEEEKLAHDVYTAMYEKYGANVFGNILKSETTHQSRVLTLLQARNIADQRSSELCVFNNDELQNLYDVLITQDNKSALEAYKVGMAVEEKDIADISNQLATTTEEDVVITLESLRSASENHLRAFNRQL